MSGDVDFKAPYVSGGDLYREIASNVYDIPYEHTAEADDTYWREHTDLTAHPRDQAKIINLAVMYGIHPFSLSKMIGETPDQAEKFIEDFYKSYPVVRSFMDEIIAKVDKVEYVETMFGRKRRFPGHKPVAGSYHSLIKRAERFNGEKLPSNHWKADLPYKLKRQIQNVKSTYGQVERQAVNAVIQGSASDILKRAMIAVSNHLKSELPDWKIISVIHDEFLIEIPETASREDIEEVARIMEETTKLDVPVVADIEVQKRWGEAVPIEEYFN